MSGQCRDVVRAEAVGWPKVFVEFDDGKAGVYDFSPHLWMPALAKLRDPAFFALVRVDHGTVAWPFDIDFSPESIYDGLESAAPGAVPRDRRE